MSFLRKIRVPAAYGQWGPVRAQPTLLKRPRAAFIGTVGNRTPCWRAALGVDSGVDLGAG